MASCPCEAKLAKFPRRYRPIESNIALPASVSSIVMPLAPVTRIDSGKISQTRLRCLESSEQWRSRSAFSTVEAAKNQQSPTMNNGFQNYRRTLHRRVPVILRQQIEQPDHAPGQRTHQNDGTEAQREHQRCLGRDPVSVEQ